MGQTLFFNNRMVSFNIVDIKIQILMIDAKINLMYSERKNKNMNSQMKKIRNEFLAKQKKQAVYFIIYESSFSIQPNHLQLLVQFAKMQQEEAIVHIGNLLIDNVISIEDLQQKQFELNTNRYCIWLIRIFHEKQYLTEECLKTLFNFIAENRGNFVEEHALPFLAQILKQKSEIINFLLSQSEKCIHVIFKCCLEGNSRRIKYSFSIISTIISESSQATERLISIIGFERLFSLLEHGLYRKQSKIRATTCQIMQNILINHEIPLKTIEHIFTICERETSKVVLQISYLLQNLMKYSVQEVRVKAFHFGLIPTLAKIVQIHQNNGEIVKNVASTLKLIEVRMEEYHELDKIYIEMELRANNILDRLKE